LKDALVAYLLGLVFATIVALQAVDVTPSDTPLFRYIKVDAPKRTIRVAIANDDAQRCDTV